MYQYQPYSDVDGSLIAVGHTRQLSLFGMAPSADMQTSTVYKKLEQQWNHSNPD